MLKVGKNQEFEIYTDQQIGEGAFSKVYCCQKKGENYQFELCAKIINITSDNKEDINREYEICQIIQQKQNPNLVLFHHLEMNELKTRLIIIMEKCISTLHKEQQEKKQYQEQEILDFLLQFINGYKVLYDQNIIHRDIKPDNILISTYDNKKYYKLADYGIARICKQNDLRITQKGTPFFASPELNILNQDYDLKKQFAGMRLQNQRSAVDIYSLGITLHAMVTGKYPFKNKQQSIIDFMNRIQKEPFQIKKSVNEQLKLLIEKMIVYDPKQRMTFQDLLEIFYAQPSANLMNYQTNFQQIPPQNSTLNQQNAARFQTTQPKLNQQNAVQQLTQNFIVNQQNTAQQQTTSQNKQFNQQNSVQQQTPSFLINQQNAAQQQTTQQNIQFNQQNSVQQQTPNFIVNQQNTAQQQTNQQNTAQQQNNQQNLMLNPPNAGRFQTQLVLQNQQTPAQQTNPSFLINQQNVAQQQTPQKNILLNQQTPAHQKNPSFLINQQNATQQLTTQQNIFLNQQNPIQQQTSSFLINQQNAAQQQTTQQNIFFNQSSILLNHENASINSSKLQIAKPDTENQTKKININHVLTGYLKKSMQIYKNIFDQAKLKTVEDYINGNCKLNEIQKLFGNFDQTLNYTKEDILFYYCLKYGLKNQSAITQISTDEQFADLKSEKY